MTTKIAFFCLLVVSCKGIFSNPFFSSDAEDPVFSSISRAFAPVVQSKLLNVVTL